MNFAVEWTEAALARLADIWTAATDQAAVTDASYRIEAAIKADPLGAGESRGDNRRVVFDPPLAVIYLVYPAERLALVNAVDLSHRPR
jgi:plasmid stabilization system protein ParE